MSGLLRGEDNPSVDEFLAHPDFRQIAAFFLGFVFINSLHHIISSAAVRRVFGRCCSFIFRRSYSDNSPLPLKDGTQTLAPTLSLCFAFASVAYFGSLLTFRPNGLGVGCSFAVAWGGISAQCARLVGLIILILELRRLGLPRWENALFWTWLFIGSVLVFLTNAVTIGVTRFVPQLNVSLCYKIHFLPVSLITSLVYLSMEVYVAARAMSLIAPPFLKIQHRLGGLQDSRVLRAISLIVFELLALASVSRIANVLYDFVFFSIGSVLVLLAFNYHITEPEAFDFRSSLCLSGRSRRSGRPSLVIEVDSRIHSHIFATISLGDPALENGEACSTDSDSEYARSVAVARVASKRSQRSGKVLRVPPLPFSAPLGSEVERGEMRETHRRILPSQVSYAKRFEREVGGLSVRPHVSAVVIPTEPTYSSSRPASGYCRSSNSAFYGSDIIRMDSNRRTNDKTKHHISILSTHGSDLTCSLRESPTSATPSYKHYSLSAPLAPPNEDLSIVHEDIYVTRSNTLRQPRKMMMRWPTFDEHRFRMAGLVNGSTISQSRPFSGVPLSLPPIPPQPSGGSRLRGPRPPPPPTERSPLMRPRSS